MALPGVKKEAVNVQLDGDLLTISSASSAETKTEDKKSSRREFQYASFERRFTLPVATEKEAIKADFENGILKITIPKNKFLAQAETKKNIAIN